MEISEIRIQSIGEKNIYGATQSSGARHSVVPNRPCTRTTRRAGELVARFSELIMSNGEGDSAEGVGEDRVEVTL